MIFLETNRAFRADVESDMQVPSELGPSRRQIGPTAAGAGKRTLGRDLLLIAALALGGQADAVVSNWVAINDHNGTASTAAPYHSIINLGVNGGGPLLNATNGSILPVGVQVTTTGTIIGTIGGSGPPDAGTPADVWFPGINWYTSGIYFMTQGSYITLTFTNLDSTKKYSIRGTAVRASDFTTRWTKVGLAGAPTGWIPAHLMGLGSPGIITNGWPTYGDSLLPNSQEVIYNTGVNTNGDVIGWDNITGTTSFSIINANYLGVLPNGGTANTYGYSWATFRLEEYFTAPARITTQPSNTSVLISNNATLTVQATGAPTPAYQWYRGTPPSGTLIPGATNNTCTITNANPANNGCYTQARTNYYCDYYVVVTNSIPAPNGTSLTSITARVTVYLAPLAITLQPPSAQTVLTNAGFTNSVQVSGSYPVFQWYYALTQAGPWATVTGFQNSGVSSNLILFPTDFTNAGYYRVVVTNWSGSVTSTATYLSVVTTAIGPYILSAREMFRTNGPPYDVRVQWSKPILRATADVATDPNSLSNFVITPNFAGPPVTVTNVRTASPYTQTQLKVDGLLSESNYVLTVNNVRDTSGNVIAPDSKVAIWFNEDIQIQIFPMDNWWRWNEEGVDLGTAWRTNNLEDVVYGYGPAIFHYPGYASGNCPGAGNTMISIGPITYYFTTQFELTNVVPSAQLTLRGTMDNGGVYYLNGLEIFRTNMPAGSVSNSTLSTGNTGCFTNQCNVTNLVSGQNILAVELHQSSSTDYYFYFGLELSGQITKTFALPEEPVPAVQIQRQSDLLTLSWTGGGYALEGANNVGGPWIEVQPDMANPYRTGVTNGEIRFWRLHRKQF